MGQSKEDGVGATPEQVTEAPRLNLAAVAAAGDAGPRTVDIGGATVVVRSMTRAEFLDLGIDEDSDARDDEASIIAASVVEPKATAEEWRDALGKMSPGTAGVLISAVMAENGLGAEVGRQLARTFRP